MMTRGKRKLVMLLIVMGEGTVVIMNKRVKEEYNDENGDSDCGGDRRSKNDSSLR